MERGSNCSTTRSDIQDIFIQLSGCFGPNAHKFWERYFCSQISIIFENKTNFQNIRQHNVKIGKINSVHSKNLKFLKSHRRPCGFPPFDPLRNRLCTLLRVKPRDVFLHTPMSLAVPTIFYDVSNFFNSKSSSQWGWVPLENFSLSQHRIFLCRNFYFPRK